MEDFTKLKHKDIQSIVEMIKDTKIENKNREVIDLSDEDFEKIIYNLLVIKNSYLINESLMKINDSDIDNIINYNKVITENDEVASLPPLENDEMEELIERLNIINYENRIKLIELDKNINHHQYTINFYLHHLDNVIVSLLPIIGIASIYIQLQNGQNDNIPLIMLLTIIGELIGTYQRYINMGEMINIEDEFDVLFEEEEYYESEKREKVKKFGPKPIYYGYDNTIIKY